MKIQYLLVLALLLFQPSNSVIAQGQEVCPNSGNGWIKIDNLNGYSFTYTADEGYFVAESCYKASTNVVYKTYEPPQQTVVITTVDHELSHVSVRVVETPEVTSTPEITETPEQTATPTPEITLTPNPTATPGDVITEVNTGTSGLPLILFGIGGLAALAIIAVNLFRKKTVI
jgi:hypothetical protein